MRTNLESSSHAQKVIIDYLEENASDVLVNKINNCGKNIDDCWKFIISQAKKKAERNCACIADAEVFGWAVHYFEEEGNVEIDNKPIKAMAAVTAPKPEPKKEETKKVEPKKKPDALFPGQMTIMDFMGG